MVILHDKFETLTSNVLTETNLTPKSPSICQQGQNLSALRKLILMIVFTGKS